MRKKTHVEYVEELNQKNIDLEPLEKYLGSDIPIIHKCKICEYEWPVRPGNILHGDRCPNCSGKRKKTHEEYVAQVAQLNPNIEIIEKYISRHTPILHRCKIDGHEWKPTPGSILKGEGCPVCSHRTIGKNFENSIWASEYKEFFSNYFTEDQMKTMMPNSSKLAPAICPDCGKMKMVSPNRLFETHSLGCICSDGISYSNKFMYSVLNQLNIEYKPEKTFEWSDNKRYDIYIPLLNCIIENHGEQHYTKSFCCIGSRTLEEEQENDNYKKELALNNGIEYYIVLDCRKSNIDWVQNSIMNSILPKILALSSINWIKCNEFACSNLVNVAANLWNKGMGVYAIAKEMHLCDATVRKYLKQAQECNLCDYTKENSYKRMGAKNKKENHHMARITVQFDNDFKVIKLWKYITEAEIALDISMKHISSCCYGDSQTAGGYKWKFLYDVTRRNGNIVPGAITLGLITEEEVLRQLNNPT